MEPSIQQTWNLYEFHDADYAYATQQDDENMRALCEINPKAVHKAPKIGPFKD